MTTYPMHVVIVADHAHINGGQMKVAIESALGLAARGHTVTYFAAVGPADPRLSEAGIRTIVLGQDDLKSSASLTRYGLQWLWNRPAAAALAALLEHCNPSATVLHVHAWAKVLSPSLGPVLAASRVPVVFTMHEYYTACPNGGFYDYPKAAPCHRVPLSAACIGHNCDSRSYARKLMRVGRHALTLWGGLARSPDAVITISDLQRAALQPYLPANIPFFDVSNPVDVAPLGPKPDPSAGDLVFVGRLSPEKGPALYGEAAKRLSLRPVFVGDGPLREDLLARFPDAEITGWLSPTETAQRVRAARAIVFPSVWYEGQPLIVLESLALGTPVIVSDVCAARESVIDGVSGVWFRSGDVDALAAAMAQFADDRHVAAMSHAAYDRFWADASTLDRHLDRIETVYRSVLAPVDVALAERITRRTSAPQQVQVPSSG